MKTLKTYKEIFETFLTNKLDLPYAVGDYIRLIEMNDQYAPKPGSIGKIISIDDIGNIHIEWFNSKSNLALIPELDKFEILTDKEVDILNKKKDFNL